MVEQVLDFRDIYLLLATGSIPCISTWFESINLLNYSFVPNKPFLLVLKTHDRNEWSALIIKFWSKNFPIKFFVIFHQKFPVQSSVSKPGLLKIVPTKEIRVGLFCSSLFYVRGNFLKRCCRFFNRQKSISNPNVTPQNHKSHLKSSHIDKIGIFLRITWKESW